MNINLKEKSVKNMVHKKSNESFAFNYEIENKFNKRIINKQQILKNNFENLSKGFSQKH